MPVRFYGVISPFITPFREDFSIDVEGVKWLARYQVERGVHGIFPNSTTGEFVHLTRDEAILITRLVIEEVGDKAWVIPGISANYTEDSVNLGRIFRDMGVSGVIVTPPYFFKISAEKLKLHFSTILEKLDLPVIIYNIPATTGINIPINLYLELIREYSNLVGAKITYENFTYFRQLIQVVKGEKKDFAVLTGLDELLLPVLMMGGDGGIMALANVAPQIHRSIYNAFIKGDLRKALEEWHKLLKLVRVYDYASSFPTAIKTLLKVLNAPIKPYPRPPLTLEKLEVEEKIREIVRELNLTL
ncbi:MAG: dihydrodipicolinate synthase family protein [Desulfurococcaceae archaeon]|jgi:4-hydroxy-tetrahydrodipicolinate synthase|nr:dihydrodipicolinate synthase family protein [Desulfurococcaceae archaeon]